MRTPRLLGGPGVAVADVVDERAIVLVDHRVATFVARADDRRLDGLVDARVAEVEGTQHGRDGGGLEEVAARDAQRDVRILAAQGSLLCGQYGHDDGSEGVLRKGAAKSA